MRTLINVVLFQCGWFACVLAARHGTPWLGVALVAVVVTVHLVFLGKSHETRLIAASVLIGTVFDTALMHSGLVVYASTTAPDWLAPSWILAMWANFAITLNHSLSQIQRRPALAVALGALGGPLAYWGAGRLGAVSLPHPLPACVALAVIWSIAIPLLLWANDQFIARRPRANPQRRLYPNSGPG